MTANRKTEIAESPAHIILPEGLSPTIAAMNPLHELRTKLQGSLGPLQATKALLEAQLKTMSRELEAILATIEITENALTNVESADQRAKALQESENA